LKALFKNVVKELPYVKKLYAKLDGLRQERDRLGEERDRLRQEAEDLRRGMAQLQAGHHFPPGHYYSPIPCIEEIKSREAAIFDTVPRQLPGIDLNETEQASLFKEFTPFFAEAPWPADKVPHLRYHHVNGWYPFGDAIFLYCMMRHRRPKRVIEVGSGYSSCVILDTNELFLGNTVTCTFIEPHPERLMSVLREEDKKRIDLVCKPLQELPLSFFSGLGPGDILLIDSTHVSKTGSDVNYLFFEVLPSLRSGVAVHVHDVWYPFQYPRAWVYQGWAWNEDYLLRAFLQYNQAFKVLFFNTLWYRFHAEQIRAKVPLALDSGGSIWLRKV
jgi:hypothetical protein